MNLKKWWINEVFDRWINEVEKMTLNFNLSSIERNTKEGENAKFLIETGILE